VTEGLTWRGRLVRVVGGVVQFSAEGDASDWNYAPDSPSEKMAVAGRPMGSPVPIDVQSLRPLDDERLLMMCGGRLFVLHGNPAAKDARIEEVFDGPPPDAIVEKPAR
jgi:hypothetical protein